MKYSRTILGWLVVCVCFIFLLKAMVNAASGVDWRLIERRWPLILAALALQVINLISQYWSWRFLVGVNPRRGSRYAEYCYAFMSRLLPAGKAIQFVTFVSNPLAGGRGWSSAAAYLASNIAGWIAALILLVWAAYPELPVLAVGAGLAAMISCRILSQVRWPFQAFFARKKVKWPEGWDHAWILLRTLSVRRMGGVVGFNLILGWGSDTLAMGILLQAAGVDVGWMHFSAIAACNVGSTFAGHLAFFVPAGLGVRDASLAALLAPRFGGWFPATFVSLSMRFLYLAAEVIFLIPFFWIRIRGTRVRDFSSSEEFREQVKTLYDAWTEADAYPRLADWEYDDVLGVSSRIRRGGATVLEVGCGSGRVSARIRNRSNRVIGVDLSEKAIAHALAYGNIDQGIVSDGSSLPIEDSSIDAVVCWGVLLHVFDLNGFFQEAARVLKPGGEILIVDHYSRNPYVWLHFSRPDWVDRCLEGRSNVARHPLSPEDLIEASETRFRWLEPQTRVLFTRHPNRLIDGVHVAARRIFGLLKRLFPSLWAGNMLVMVGVRDQSER